MVRSLLLSETLSGLLGSTSHTYLIGDGSRGAFAHAFHASGGVTVDLDITIVGQIVLFVFLFLVLKPLLFNPMLRLFDERERRIDGAKAEARQMYTDADAKMAKYEEELAVVKRTAGEQRDRLRDEGRRAEQQIMASVNKEIQATLEDGRRKISSEAKTLRGELSTAAQSIARDVASRVLGREVQL